MSTWQLIPNLLIAFATFGVVGCASVGGAVDHRNYGDCLHSALRGVVEGFVCVDDGQIAGAKFSGHVVFQTASGSLRSVSDAEFWQGWGDGAGGHGPLTRVDVEVGPDGWFSHPQLVHYSASWQEKGGRLVATQQVEDVVFVVRASDCRDYTVHFRPDDPDHIILMDCSDKPDPDHKQVAK